MNNLILSQYQTSKWAAEPLFLESFIRRISQLKVNGSLADIEVAARPRTYSVIEGLAVINISGVLLKTVPGWLRFWGIEATGYDEINAQLGQAMTDDSIKGIHLQVSSPGGIVDGLAATADAIFAARQSKKVTATIEDLGASAAYWLTSQAETIEAGKTAEIGSIGVYTVYLDSSKAAEDEGYKVVLIKSGEHKGMGVAGVEISDEQIEAVQENIDAIAGQFVDSVARGRGKEAGDIKPLATGRLWIADKAKKLGLIDSVTVRENKSSQSDIKGETVMENENENKVQAEQIARATAEASTAALDEERQRIKAINEKFGDDLEFANKAISEGWTVAEAHEAFNDVLRERLKEKNSQSSIDNSQSQGSAAIPTGDTDGGGAEGDFMAEARELAETKKISVTAAMKKLARQKPALHEAFLGKCKTSGREMYAEAG